MLENRVIKNISALAILQVFNYVTPLVVLIYLTRVLGVNIYGVVAYSIAIVQLSYVVTDFGFSLAATEKISIHRNRKRYVSLYLGSIFLVKSIIFILLVVVLMTYAFNTEKYYPYYLIFVISLLPIFGQTFQPVWFFLGIERMFHITIFTVTSKISYIFLVIVLVSKGEDYLWVPVANGVSQIIAAVIGIFFIYRSGYRIRMPTTRYIKYTFRTALGFFSSRVSVAAYANGGVFVLGLFSTPHLVAIYSLAEQLYKAMQSVFIPISQAIYPYMAKRKNFEVLASLMFICFLIVSILAMIGYLVSPHLIYYVLGEDWLSILPVLNLFFLIIIVNTLGVMSGYPLASALSKIYIANQSAVCASIIYLSGVVVLCYINHVTPFYLAMMVLVAELYVLIHRGAKLWPEAFKEIKRSGKVVK